jgi:hypothetical protein
MQERLSACMQERGDDFGFDPKRYLAILGLPALSCGNTVEEVLTARWCMPTMSITNVMSSTTNQTRTSFGPTRFSVIPNYAQV